MNSHRQAPTILGIFVVIAFVLLIAVSFGTAPLESKMAQHIHALIVNLAFALLSIAGTVLVVDRLNEARDAEEERRRLVRDMSSRDAAIAARGVRELAELGALAGGYLRGRDLSGANLSGARLQGIVLAGGKLIGAQLDSADLSRADLAGCTLNSANFSGATLERANLGSSQCVGTDFSHSDLDNANMTAGNFQAASFENAELRNVDLRDGDFRQANFQGALLADAKCLGAKFDEAFASRIGITNFQRYDDYYVCSLEGPLVG